MMASFFIEGGKLKFQGINGKSWKFSNVNTEINVKNGVLEKSLLKGGFAGLKGNVELDWNTPEKVVQVNFNGNTKEIVSLMPDFLQKGMAQKFGGGLEVVCSYYIYVWR